MKIRGTSYIQYNKVLSIVTIVSVLSMPFLVQADAVTGAPEKSNIDMLAKELLDKAYGQYNAQKNCWETMDDNQRYCMKIDRADKRETATGSRLYLLVAGEAVDEEGNPNGSHASSGLIGAFVQEKHNGKVSSLSSTPKIQVGEYGSPPTDWKFVQLGSSDYWGWQNTVSGGNQGIFGTRLLILAPYRNEIRNLAGFLTSYDNSGYREQNSTSIESTLVIDDTHNGTSKLIMNGHENSSKFTTDTSKNAEKVYPLRMTVTGKLKGKHLAPKIWILPFNFKKWAYSEPTNWPLKIDDAF